MGIICFSECGACQRHVRCEERVCPFCGTAVVSQLRVLDYRLLTRLDRSRALSLSAALAAAGFVTACSSTESVPVYGAPCNPPSCVVPQAGTGGVPAGAGTGAGGTTSEGGNGSGGLGGTASEGGNGSGGSGGATSDGGDGSGGAGGATSDGGDGSGGAGGATSEGGSGGEGGD
jgi:hypothetical protein